MNKVLKRIALFVTLNFGYFALITVIQGVVLLSGLTDSFNYFFGRLFSVILIVNFLLVVLAMYYNYWKNKKIR